MDREAIEEAIEVLEDASAEMLAETGDENYYSEAIAVLRQALETGAEVERLKLLCEEMLRELYVYRASEYVRDVTAAIRARSKQ